MSTHSPISPSTAQTSTIRFALDTSVRLFGATLNDGDASRQASSSEESTIYDSSDEDAGVFFGARQPLENDLISKLSCESPIPGPSKIRKRPSEVIVRRVKKRDSREFLRRKTMLVNEIKESPLERRNSRGSREQRNRRSTEATCDRESESESETSSKSIESTSTFADPSSRSQRYNRSLSRVETTISNDDFRLSFSAIDLKISSPMMSYPNEVCNIDRSGIDANEEGEVNEHEESLTDDSDKENTALPIEYSTENDGDEQADPIASDGPRVVLGMLIPSESDEESGLLKDNNNHSDLSR